MKNYAGLPCDRCGAVPESLNLGQCAPCAEISGRRAIVDRDNARGAALKAEQAQQEREREDAKRRKQEAADEAERVKRARARHEAIGAADSQTKGLFARPDRADRSIRGWLDEMAKTGESFLPEASAPTRSRVGNVVGGALVSAELATRSWFRRSNSGFDAHVATDSMTQANWQAMMRTYAARGGQPKLVIARQFHAGNIIHVLLNDQPDRLVAGVVSSSLGTQERDGFSPQNPLLSISIDGPSEDLCLWSHDDSMRLWGPVSKQAWEWRLAPSCPKPSNPFPDNRYPDGW